jgi:hypothetical protein
LLASAACVHLLTTQYLLEDGGANMEAVNDAGETVWDMLILCAHADDEDE